MPAVLYWLGGGSNTFGTVGDWTLDPVNKTPAATTPQAGDTAVYDGTVSNTDCQEVGAADPYGYNFLPGLDTIRVVNGYAGVLGFPHALSVGTFTLTSGTVRTDQYADLTVTGTFTWTGGTLNYAGPLVNLILSGATATIAPEGGGTLTTGDNLNFTNGATGTITAGTINFANGAGMDVGQNCAVTVNANDGNGRAATVTFSGVGKPWAETDKQITLQTGATVTVTGPGPWNVTGPAPDNNPKQIINNGGTIEIKDQATVSVDAPPGGGYPVQQTAGTIKLHTGSNIVVASGGVLQSGGTLQIVGDPVDIGATITGRFDFTAGTIDFTGNYAIVTVTDQVTWRNGTYKPRIDVTANATADTWLMGSLVIAPGSTPSIAPDSINYLGEGQSVDPSYRWRVIKINGAVTTNNITPTIIHEEDPGYDRFIVRNPDNTTEWQLGCPDGF